MDYYIKFAAPFPSFTHPSKKTCKYILNVSNFIGTWSAAVFKFFIFYYYFFLLRKQAISGGGLNWIQDFLVILYQPLHNEKESRETNTDTLTTLVIRHSPTRHLWAVQSKDLEKNWKPIVRAWIIPSRISSKITLRERKSICENESLWLALADPIQPIDFCNSNNQPTSDHETELKLLSLRYRLELAWTPKQPPRPALESPATPLQTPPLIEYCMLSSRLVLGCDLLVPSTHQTSHRHYCPQTRHFGNDRCWQNPSRQNFMI